MALSISYVIDCHTKAVIGWATGDNYKTPLISAAIEMAVRNNNILPGAIFHSDRGSNYTSEEFAATLALHDMRQSVGRTGVCYDNAMAESFFAALKNELVHRTQYPTRGRGTLHTPGRGPSRGRVESAGNWQARLSTQMRRIGCSLRTGKPRSGDYPTLTRL